MAELPGYLRWLEWVAGSDWPAGDPDGMWGLAGDWHTAASSLRDILTDLDNAKRASLAAYPNGEGSEEAAKLFDDLRSGDQSLAKLAEIFDKVGDGAHSVGTEIEYAQLMMITSLALLAAEIAAAWLFPPTAPATEAAAIGFTRVGIRILGQRLMNKIIQWVAKFLGEKIATFLVRHLAIDTIIGTLQDLGIQEYQVAAGHRDDVNWQQVAVTAASSAAGAGLANPAGEWIGNQLSNTMKPWLRGAITGAGAGAIGAVGGYGGSIVTQFGFDWANDGWDAAVQNAKNTDFDWRMLTAGVSNGAMSGGSRAMADAFYHGRHPDWYARPGSADPRIGFRPPEIDTPSRDFGNDFGDGNVRGNGYGGNVDGNGFGGDHLGGQNGHVNGDSSVNGHVNGDGSVDGHVDGDGTVNEHRAGAVDGGPVDGGPTIHESPDGSVEQRPVDTASADTTGATQAHGDTGTHTAEDGGRVGDENAAAPRDEGTTSTEDPAAHQDSEIRPDTQTTDGAPQEHRTETDTTHQESTDTQSTESETRARPVEGQTTETTTTHESEVAAGHHETEAPRVAEPAADATTRPADVTAHDSAVHDGTTTQRTDTPVGAPPQSAAPQSATPLAGTQAGAPPSGAPASSSPVATGASSAAPTSTHAAGPTQGGEPRALGANPSGKPQAGPAIDGSRRMPLPQAESRAGAVDRVTGTVGREGPTQSGTTDSAAPQRKSTEGGHVRARDGETTEATAPRRPEQDGTPPREGDHDGIPPEAAALAVLPPPHPAEGGPNRTARAAPRTEVTRPEVDGPPPDSRVTTETPVRTDDSANRGECGRLALAQIHGETGSAHIRVPSEPVGPAGMSRAEVEAAAGAPLRDIVAARPGEPPHQPIADALLARQEEGASALVVDEYAGPTGEYGVGAHAYVLTVRGHPDTGVLHVEVSDPSVGLREGFPPTVPKELNRISVVMYDAAGVPLHPADIDGTLLEHGGHRVGESDGPLPLGEGRPQPRVDPVVDPARADRHFPRAEVPRHEVTRPDVTLPDGIRSETTPRSETASDQPRRPDGSWRPADPTVHPDARSDAEVPLHPDAENRSRPAEDTSPDTDGQVRPGAETRRDVESPRDTEAETHPADARTLRDAEAETRPDIEDSTRRETEVDTRRATDPDTRRDAETGTRPEDAVETRPGTDETRSTEPETSAAQRDSTEDAHRTDSAPLRDEADVPRDPADRDGEVLHEGTLPEGGDPLYRGVPRLLADGSVNPAYLRAVRGIAEPRGSIDLSADEHIRQIDPAESDTTSWTRSRGVAETFAHRDGVILEWRTGLPPEDATWRFKPIFDIDGDLSQVLIQGTLPDARAVRYIAPEVGGVHDEQSTPPHDDSADTTPDRHEPAPIQDEWSGLDPAEVGRELAHRTGLETFGFDQPGIHPEAAREYARAVVDMRRDFPNVDLRRVGIGELNGTVAGRTYSEIDPATGRRYTESIVLSVRDMSDPADFTSRLAENVARGRFSEDVLDRPIHSLFVHEYGHAIDAEGQHQARMDADDELLGHYMRTHDPATIDGYHTWREQLSGYSFDADGQLRPHEAVPEAFREVYLRGENASEPAKVLDALLRDAARRHTQDPGTPRAPEPDATTVDRISESGAPRSDEAGPRPDSPASRDTAARPGRDTTSSSEDSTARPVRDTTRPADDPARTGEDHARADDPSRRDDLDTPQDRDDHDPSHIDDEWSHMDADDIRRTLEERHGLEVVGFDRDTVSLTDKREFARAVDEMLRKHPEIDLRMVRIAPIEGTTHTGGRIAAKAEWGVHPDDIYRYHTESITLNELVAGDAAAFRRTMRDAERTFFFNRGAADRPVHSTIVHEMGHALDYAGGMRARGQAEDALFAHYSEGRDHVDPDEYEVWRNQLSGYSFKRNDIFSPEALAEAFRDVEINGDRASEPARVLYDLMVREARTDPDTIVHDDDLIGGPREDGPDAVHHDPAAEPVHVPPDRWSGLDAEQIRHELEQRHGLEVIGFDNPNVHVDVLREFARAVDERLTRFPNIHLDSVRIEPMADGQFARATSFQRPEDGRHRYTESITLNERLATDPDLLRRSIALNIEDGHFAPHYADRPVYSLIVHEFGHALDTAGSPLTRMRVDSDLLRYYMRTHDEPTVEGYNAWLHEQLPGLSFDSRGSLNPAEALPEGFADVERNGEHASPASKVLNAALLHAQEMYGEPRAGTPRPDSQTPPPTRGHDDMALDPPEPRPDSNAGDGSDRPPDEPPVPAPGDEPPRGDRSEWYLRMQIDQAEWEARMAAEHAEWLREAADRPLPHDPLPGDDIRQFVARVRAENAELAARLAADRVRWLRDLAAGRLGETAPATPHTSESQIPHPDTTGAEVPRTETPRTETPRTETPRTESPTTDPASRPESERDRVESPDDWFERMRVEQAEWEARMDAERAEWLRGLADQDPDDFVARMRAEQAEWEARMGAERAAWLRQMAGLPETGTGSTESATHDGTPARDRTTGESTETTRPLAERETTDSDTTDRSGEPDRTEGDQPRDEAEPDASQGDRERSDDEHGPLDPVAEIEKFLDRHAEDATAVPRTEAEQEYARRLAEALGLGRHLADHPDPLGALRELAEMARARGFLGDFGTGERPRPMRHPDDFGPLDEIDRIYGDEPYWRAEASQPHLDEIAPYLDATGQGETPPAVEPPRAPDRPESVPSELDTTDRGPRLRSVDEVLADLARRFGLDESDLSPDRLARTIADLRYRNMVRAGAVEALAAAVAEHDRARGPEREALAAVRDSWARRLGIDPADVTPELVENLRRSVLREAAEITDLADVVQTLREPPPAGEVRHYVVDVDGERVPVRLVADGRGGWRVEIPERHGPPAVRPDAPVQESTPERPKSLLRRIWDRLRGGYEGHTPKYPSGSGIDGQGQREIIHLAGDVVHSDVLSQFDGNPARLAKESATMWKRRELIPFLNHLTGRVNDRAAEYPVPRDHEGDEYTYWLDEADPDLVRRELGVELEDLKRAYEQEQQQRTEEQRREPDPHPDEHRETDPALPPSGEVTRTDAEMARMVRELTERLAQRAELGDALAEYARRLGVDLGDLSPEQVRHAVSVLEYRLARRMGALFGLAEAAARYNAEDGRIPYSDEINFFDNDPMSRFLAEVVRANDGRPVLFDWEGVNNGGEPLRDWGDLSYSDQPGRDQGPREYFENALRRDQIKDERAVWAQILGLDLDALGPETLHDTVADQLAEIRRQAEELRDFTADADRYLHVDGEVRELADVISSLALHDWVLRQGGAMLTPQIGLLAGEPGGPHRLVVIDGAGEHDRVLAEALARNPRLADAVNDGTVRVEYRSAALDVRGATADGRGTVYLVDGGSPEVRHLRENVDGRPVEVTMVRDEDGPWRAVPTDPDTAPHHPELGPDTRTPEEIRQARDDLARRLGIDESDLRSPERLAERIAELRRANAIRASQIEAIIDYARTAWDIDNYHTLSDARNALANRLGVEPHELTPRRVGEEIADPKTRNSRRLQQVESLVKYAKLLRGLDAPTSEGAKAAVDAARDRLARRLGVDPSDLYPLKHSKDLSQYRPDPNGLDAKKLRAVIAKLVSDPAQRARVADALTEYAATLERIDPFVRGERALPDPRVADVELPHHDRAVDHLHDVVGDVHDLVDALDRMGLLDDEDIPPGPDRGASPDWAKIVGVDLTDADAARWGKIYEVYRDGKIDQHERLTPAQLAEVQAELRAQTQRRADELDALADLARRYSEAMDESRPPELPPADPDSPPPPDDPGDDGGAPAHPGPTSRPPDDSSSGGARRPEAETEESAVERPESRAGEPGDRRVWPPEGSPEEGTTDRGRVEDGSDRVVPEEVTSEDRAGSRDSESDATDRRADPRSGPERGRIGDVESDRVVAEEPSSEVRSERDETSDSTRRTPEPDEQPSADRSRQEERASEADRSAGGAQNPPHEPPRTGLPEPEPSGWRPDGPPRPHEPFTDEFRDALPELRQRIADAVAARTDLERSIAERAGRLGIPTDGRTPHEISSALEELTRQEFARVEGLRNRENVPGPEMVQYFADLRAAQQRMSELNDATRQLRSDLGRYHRARAEENTARADAAVRAARDVLASEGADMVSEGVGLVRGERRVVVASPLAEPDPVLSEQNRRQLADQGIPVEYRMVTVDERGVEVTTLRPPEEGGAEDRRAPENPDSDPAGGARPPRPETNPETSRHPEAGDTEGESRVAPRVRADTDDARSQVRTDERGVLPDRGEVIGRDARAEADSRITPEARAEIERLRTERAEAADQLEQARETRAERARRLPVDPEADLTRDELAETLDRLRGQTMRVDEMPRRLAEIDALEEAAEAFLDAEDRVHEIDQQIEAVRLAATPEGVYDALVHRRAVLASEREFWRAKRDDRFSRFDTRALEHPDPETALDHDNLTSTVEQLSAGVVGTREIAGFGDETGTQAPELVGETEIAERMERVFKLQEAAERFNEADQALIDIDQRIADLDAAGAGRQRPPDPETVAELERLLRERAEVAGARDKFPDPDAALAELDQRIDALRAEINAQRTAPSAEIAAELDRLARERADRVLANKPWRVMRDDLAARLRVDPDRLGPRDLAETIDEVAGRTVRAEEVEERARQIELLREAAEHVNRADNEIGRLQDRIAELGGATRDVLGEAGARQVTDRVGIVDGEHPRIVVVAPRGDLAHPRADHDAALHDALRRDASVAQAFMRPETTIEYRQIVADREGGWHTEDLPAPRREILSTGWHDGRPGIHMVRWRDGEGHWHPVDPTRPDWQTHSDPTVTVPKKFSPRDLPEGVSGWASEPFQASVVDPFIDHPPGAIDKDLLPRIPGGDPIDTGIPTFEAPFAGAGYNLTRIILESAKLSGFTWFSDKSHPGRIKPGFKGHPWFRPRRAEVQPMAREWNVRDGVPDNGNLSEEWLRGQQAAQERWARVQEWADGEYARFRADDSDIDTIVRTLDDYRAADRTERARDLVDRIAQQLADRGHVDVEGLAETLRGQLRDERPGDAEQLVTDIRDVLRDSTGVVDRADLARPVADQLTDTTPEFTREQIEQIKNHLMRDNLLVRDPRDGVLVRRPLDAVADVAEAWNRLIHGNPLPQDILMLRDGLAESGYLRANPTATWRDANQHVIMIGLDWNANRPPRTDWRAGIPYAPAPITHDNQLPPRPHDGAPELPPGPDTDPDTAPRSPGDLDTESTDTESTDTESAGIESADTESTDTAEIPRDPATDPATDPDAATTDLTDGPATETRRDPAPDPDAATTESSETVRHPETDPRRDPVVDRDIADESGVDGDATTEPRGPVPRPDTAATEPVEMERDPATRARRDPTSDTETGSADADRAADAANRDPAITPETARTEFSDTARDPATEPSRDPAAEDITTTVDTGDSERTPRPDDDRQARPDAETRSDNRRDQADGHGRRRPATSDARSDDEQPTADSRSDDDRGVDGSGRHRPTEPLAATDDEDSDSRPVGDRGRGDADGRRRPATPDARSESERNEGPDTDSRPDSDRGRVDSERRPAATDDDRSEPEPRTDGDRDRVDGDGRRRPALPDSLDDEGTEPSSDRDGDRVDADGRRRPATPDSSSDDGGAESSSDRDGGRVDGDSRRRPTAPDSSTDEGADTESSSDDDRGRGNGEGRHRPSTPDESASEGTDPDGSSPGDRDRSGTGDGDDGNVPPSGTPDREVRSYLPGSALRSHIPHPPKRYDFELPDSPIIPAQDPQIQIPPHKPDTPRPPHRPEPPHRPDPPHRPQPPGRPRPPQMPQPPQQPQPPKLPEPPQPPELPQPPESPEPPQPPELPQPPDCPQLPELPQPPDCPQPPELPEPPQWPEFPAPPGDPGLPEAPGRPEFPNPPGVPGQPRFPETPGWPNFPTPPGGPSEPGLPEAPGGPRFPTPPGGSDLPGRPGSQPFPVPPSGPGHPGWPGSPQLPTPPNLPGVPDAPGWPDRPGAPSAPWSPEAPNPPGGTHAPGVPEMPGAPDHPGAPTRPWPPEPPSHPEVPGAPHPDGPAFRQPPLPDAPGIPGDPHQPWGPRPTHRPETPGIPQFPDSQDHTDRQPNGNGHIPSEQPAHDPGPAHAPNGNGKQATPGQDIPDMPFSLDTPAAPDFFSGLDQPSTTPAPAPEPKGVPLDPGSTNGGPHGAPSLPRSGHIPVPEAPEYPAPQPDHTGHSAPPDTSANQPANQSGMGAFPAMPPMSRGGAATSSSPFPRANGHSRANGSTGANGSAPLILVRSHTGYGEVAEFDPATGTLRAVAGDAVVCGVFGEIAGVQAVFYRDGAGLALRLGDRVIDLEDQRVTVYWLDDGPVSHFRLDVDETVVCALRYPATAADYDLGLMIRDILADPERRAWIFTR